MTAAPQLLFRALELENVFSYREARVDFEPGLSVFAGDNGSGKTSLLEAVFFALFGSETKKITGRQLAEVLREGEARGSLALDFSLGPRQFRVELSLRRTGGRVSADGPRCRLFEDGSEVASHVTPVTAALQGALKMDAEDFAHCLYVRQGEVDRLIQARPEDRQRTIDRLLRLSRIDDYQARLKVAVTASNSRQTKLQGAQETVGENLQTLESAGLPAARERLRRQLAELEAEQRGIRGQISDTEVSIRDTERALQAHEQTLQRMRTLQDEYRELEQALVTQQDEANALRSELRAGQERLRQGRQALDVWLASPAWIALNHPAGAPLAPAIERAESQRHECDRALQAVRQTLAGLRGERETRQAQIERLKRRCETLAGAGEEQARALAELEDALEPDLAAFGLAQRPPSQVDPNSLDAERQAALDGQLKQRDTHQRALANGEAELNSVRQQLDEAAALQAAGRCPTCRQPVSAQSLAAHTGPLKARAAQLTEEIGQHAHSAQAAAAEIERLTAERRALDGLRQRLDRWRLLRERAAQQTQDAAEAAAELEQSAERIESLSGQLAERADREGALARQLDGLSGRLGALQRALALEEAAAQRAREVEALERRLDSLGKLLNDRRQTLREKSERFDALGAELGELDPQDGQNRLDQARQHLERLNTHQEALQQRRDALQVELGRVDADLARLEELRQQRAQQADAQAALDGLLGDLDRIGQTYAQVKAGQRQKYFAVLNEVFNELFALMNPGPAYAGARLGDRFDIEVVCADDRTLAPSLLSGGERALLNLALRAALHRVITEAGGLLLPLVFDEPTVFLDAAHVQQLERLFEQLGRQVGQVIVVSHETSLVESADHEYRVSKNAENLSLVDRLR